MESKTLLINEGAIGDMFKRLVGKGITESTEKAFKTFIKQEIDKTTLKVAKNIGKNELKQLRNAQNNILKNSKLISMIAKDTGIKNPNKLKSIIDDIFVKTLKEEQEALAKKSNKTVKTAVKSGFNQTVTNYELLLKKIPKQLNKTETQILKNSLGTATSTITAGSKLKLKQQVVSFFSNGKITKQNVKKLSTLQKIKYVTLSKQTIRTLAGLGVAGALLYFAFAGEGEDGIIIQDENGDEITGEDGIIIQDENGDEITNADNSPVATNRQKYHNCTNFPFEYGCRNQAIKDIQTKIEFPLKWQTGNFGPITLNKLNELGYQTKGTNDVDYITKEIYDKIMGNFEEREESPEMTPIETPEPAETSTEMLPQTGNNTVNLTNATQNTNSELSKINTNDEQLKNEYIVKYQNNFDAYAKKLKKDGIVDDNAIKNGFINKNYGKFQNFVKNKTLQEDVMRIKNMFKRILK